MRAANRPFTPPSLTLSLKLCLFFYAYGFVRALLSSTVRMPSVTHSALGRLNDTTRKAQQSATDSAPAAAGGARGPGPYRSARAELLSAKPAMPCYTAQVRRLDALFAHPPLYPYELRGPNHRAHGDHESSQRLAALDR